MTMTMNNNDYLKTFEDESTLYVQYNAILDTYHCTDFINIFWTMQNFDYEENAGS